MPTGGIEPEEQLRDDDHDENRGKEVFRRRGSQSLDARYPNLLVSRKIAERDRNYERRDWQSERPNRVVQEVEEGRPPYLELERRVTQE